MEFSPDICTGEASDPPGGFSAALCFPLSCRLEAIDLVLTILLDRPHIRRQTVSERNGKNRGKQNSLTWPLLDGDDLAEIGLEPPDTCKKGLPQVRFPRKALRRSSQVLKMSKLAGTNQEGNRVAVKFQKGRNRFFQ